MTDKHIRIVNAGLTTDDRNRPTGTVELRAAPLWLKSEPIVTAELTASEARRLAIDLLRAAERLS